MIKDLQELGKWLNENDQDDFGKNVKDDDCIFIIRANNINSKLEDINFKLEDINFKSDFSSKYFEKSCFNDEVYCSSNQNIVIPSTANLLGFSPFFIKIGDLNKFEGKVNSSINANKNNGNFSMYVNYYFEDFEKLYLSQIPFNELQKINLRFLFDNLSANDVNKLINNYYEFILSNVQNIINRINKFKEDNGLNNSTNFYLTCIFDNYLDLINDFFYFHSKFLHKRSKSVDDFQEGVCSICGNNITTYVALPCYNLDKLHSFNFQDNVKNSHLQVCRKCNSFIKYADEKLINILNVPNILIIPKVKGEGDYADFLKIANKDVNSFEKLNLFLNNCKNFNFDLIVYQKEKAVRKLKRYVENYSAFLVKFENLCLYDNNKMKYVGNEAYYNNKSTYSNLKNTFDFEQIFKELFFRFDDNRNIIYPNFNHFYEIYTRELTGSGGIFNSFTSQTVNIFSKYAENIFDFIYNVNLDALNKNMINEIVLNSLVKIQKNSFGKKNFKFDILKRLNYYFMFKKEFLGDNMLKSENVIKLKRIFGKKDTEDSFVFSNDDKSNIEKLINEDPALKYYLLGQFIAYIDRMKGKNNKNSNVFSNFIDNVTRNNIKKIFVTEILQKNNFYINKLGKKGKFVFTILEINIDILFDESNDFDYEDYILLLFTGYYAQNILINNYKFEEE